MPNQQSIRTRIIALVVIGLFALGLVFAYYLWIHRFDYPRNTANKLEVQRLLKAKQFDELESLLAKYDGLLAKDIRNEYSVYDEYGAFSIADQGIGSSLDEWIKTKPNSPTAFVARALHESMQGWYERGTDWAYKTSEKQMQGMQEKMTLAKMDAETAHRLAPTKLLPYLILIDISVVEGNRERQKYFFEQGRRLFPESMLLHHYYIYGLAPRWGGTYEEMQAFITGSQRAAEKNPSLRALAGFIDYDKGLSECNNDNQDEAIKYFTKALSYGNFWLYLEQRGNCLLAMKKYDEAMEDAQNLIRLRPQYNGALELRASCYALTNKLNEANLDYDLAKSIDPMSFPRYRASEIKVVEAYEFAKKLQWPLAFGAYTLALQIDPDNAQAYIYRGHNHYQRREFDLAIRDLSRAIELAPLKLMGYGFLDEVFCRQKRYNESIRTWSKYIALQPQKSEGYYYRGHDYFLMGDLVSAKADSKKACDLGNEKGCQQLEKFFNTPDQ